MVRTWSNKGSGKHELPPWKVKGMDEVLESTLEPAKTVEQEWTFEDLKGRVGMMVQKAAQKFYDSQACATRASEQDVAKLVRDFVQETMEKLQSSCSEKVWWEKIDWYHLMLLGVEHAFITQKCMSRTLAIDLRFYVAESLVHFVWDQNYVANGIYEAVSELSILSAEKQVRRHVSMSFDEAHPKACYGTIRADQSYDGTPAGALVMDFYKGWIRDYVERSWELLNQGLKGNFMMTRGEKTMHCQNLFQALVAKGVLPYNLAENVYVQPPSPWNWIDSVVQATVEEFDKYHGESEDAARKRAAKADAAPADPKRRRR